MTFVAQFDQLDRAGLSAAAENATAADVETALAGPSGDVLGRFARLISGNAARPEYLEEMARQSRSLTLKHFGRVMRFFAPLYLSNECVNICQYCGFSRDNPILRVTLTASQVREEAEYLWNQGFRHILLVAGEHPHFVSRGYLRDCVNVLHQTWPSISLEVGPLETAEYESIVEAGAEGLVVYQETYDRSIYDTIHVSGPKKDFNWRLETPERAYAAGFKRLGIGALLGLSPWRGEAIALAAHTEFLLKNCWSAQITISVPRLRPSAGQFEPRVHVTDRELVQLICALRLAFPQVGIVLSTREPARLRDGLVPLGITLMSAGSHTEPGGYTGQGKKDLHLTKGGRLLKPPATVVNSEGEHATVQFEIGDARSVAEVASRLQALGYEPVWKDWDSVLNEA